MKNKGLKKWLKQIGDEEKRVIIYGAGLWGNLTYDFLKEYNKIKLVGWVDKNYINLFKNKWSVPVLNPEIMISIEYDYIIIAVTTEHIITEICEFIKINGGKDEQIILIEEKDFEQNKITYFSEEKDFENSILEWKNYIYLRNKYSKYVEIRKEKNGGDSGITWLLWLQGWDNAPEVVKMCKDSIIKFNTGRKIVCLDENNYIKYIEIPKDIKEMYKNRIIRSAHYSDIIRLELLKKYGGLWIDATVFLTGKLYKFITKVPLFLYQFPKEIKIPRTISNWLIYADSHNIIIEETLSLLYMYWRTENKSISYFVMHYLFRVVSDIYAREWKAVPCIYNSNCFILANELNEPYDERRLKQIFEMARIHKLSYKLKIDKENSLYHHIIKTI